LLQKTNRTLGVRLLQQFFRKTGLLEKAALALTNDGLLEQSLNLSSFRAFGLTARRPKVIEPRLFCDNTTSSDRMAFLGLPLVRPKNYR